MHYLYSVSFLDLAELWQKCKTVHIMTILELTEYIKSLLPTGFEFNVS